MVLISVYYHFCKDRDNFDVLVSRLKKINKSFFFKQNYPTKIVVASIMGEYEEEWIELAKMAEEAGCDAVELNFSCPQMRLAGMGSDVGQDTELVTFYTAYVKRNVKIPVIPKMTPNITQINQPAVMAATRPSTSIQIPANLMSSAANVSDATSADWSVPSELWDWPKESRNKLAPGCVD